MMAKLGLFVLAALVIFPQHGCSNPLNSTVPVTEPLEPRERGTSPLADDHTRLGWERVPVRPAAGAVEHQPTYTSRMSLATETPRQRGEYPTIESAIGDSAQSDGVVAEGLVMPLRGAFLILAAPIRMAGGEWPWSVASSRAAGYAREPHRADSDRWLGIGFARNP
jgi:hypothetical protein